MGITFILSLGLILQTTDGFSLEDDVQANKQISIMSYNVGNLFDTIDDPEKRDEEFLPDGAFKWTEERLQKKMEQLAKVITSVTNPSGQKCPDFIGLAEVENAAIAQRLNREYLQECQYSKIVADPKDPDPRGIRVVSLTRLPLLGRPQSHSAYEGARFIQEVSVKAHGVPLTVFMNHWKSRRSAPGSDDDGSSKRILSAQKLKARATQILEENPEAEIIMMGDFNDEPENKSLKSALGSTFSLERMTDLQSTSIAWNPAIELLRIQELEEIASETTSTGAFKKARSTYYYGKNEDYLLLDNFHMTRGLLDDEGLTYVPHSFKVLRLKEFTNEQLAPIPFQPPKHNGASDHFPILLRLKTTTSSAFE